MEVEIERRPYPSPGRCIYCGKPGNDLTEEHIIPVAMGGALKFDGASCMACKEIIDPIEGKCINDLIGDFRLRVGFQSRKGRRLRGNITIEKWEQDGTRTRKKIPLSDYPRVLLLPHFPLPELLGGDWSQPPVFWGAVQKDDFKRVADLHGSGAGQPIKFHYPTFCRMLAKIAHGFAFAEYGEEKLAVFNLRLPDLIRLGKPPFPRAVVGAEAVVQPRSRLLNSIGLWHVFVGCDEHLVCTVRLWGVFGTPTYVVVVGTRTPNQPPPAPDQDTV